MEIAHDLRLFHLAMRLFTIWFVALGAVTLFQDSLPDRVVEGSKYAPLGNNSGRVLIRPDNAYVVALKECLFQSVKDILVATKSSYKDDALKTISLGNAALIDGSPRSLPVEISY